MAPPVRSRNPVQAQGKRLVAVDAIGPEGVVEVDTQEHGTLAVGLVGDAPFATSNVCRHQFAKLGRGVVAEGCLECPWHRARFDVRTGEMVRGPQGKVFGFGPYSAGIQAYTNTVAKLRTFPVAIRDGFIELVD